MADILEQADWYANHSGKALTRRWENAVESAVLSVVRRPATGAPCAFRSLELLGVRRVAIPGFKKHLLFYKFNEEELFVLRVVHGARDLEALL